MATEQPTQFLILHKVRGEAAFDIAHQLQIGEELGWIVSTSGHRAYPVRWWGLEDLVDASDYPHQHPWTYDADPSLAEVPDHYETAADKGRGLIKDLSALLGIKRPVVEIKRRL